MYSDNPDLTAPQDKHSQHAASEPTWVSSIEEMPPDSESAFLWRNDSWFLQIQEVCPPITWRSRPGACMPVWLEGPLTMRCSRHCLAPLCRACHTQHTAHSTQNECLFHQSLDSMLRTHVHAIQHRHPGSTASCKGITHTHLGIVAMPGLCCLLRVTLIAGLVNSDWRALAASGGCRLCTVLAWV